ncbi:MAG: SBBP repeat-containing protein [Acidobacteria bacterium]|nr:SBBP repeat-containing protein [Acidobacteriota bacterium]
MHKNFMLVFSWLLFHTGFLSAQVGQQWIARYNGSGNGTDYATALAVDADGNVYVTGYSYGVGTGSDYATVKYDAAGNQLWVARYNGPGNSWDWASALAVDANGNVYVTGWSLGVGTENDYATVKYDAAGNQLWVARYHGPGNSGDGASALAVDAEGNVYVTGGSVGVYRVSDYATVKYDAAGNQLWVARYNGPGNSGRWRWMLVAMSM